MQEYFTEQYEVTAFRNAATKKELCNVGIINANDGLNSTKTDDERFIKGCMKQKSDNVFLCPEKELQDAKNPTIISRNKKFKKIIHSKGKKEKKKKKKSKKF